MSTKQEALELIRSLPEGCTWGDVFRAVAQRVTTREADGGPWRVAELRAEYGPAESVYEGGEVRMRDFDVVIERDAEGVYVASVPALRGCHTQAGTLDQLYERVREAIELCVEVPGGAATGTELVGVRRISVPA